MANPEHLAMPRKGVDAWNEWRSQNYYTQADLSRADLASADLRDADLHHVNLNRANLWGADLRDADLRGADLTSADDQYGQLCRCDLRKATLTGAGGSQYGGVYIFQKLSGTVMRVYGQETSGMTHEEIEAMQRKLQDIVEKHTTQNNAHTMKVLGELAKKVGASTQTVFPDIIQPGKRISTDAAIPELAHNIHFALQTASMIDACRTAAKNIEFAERALAGTRRAQFWTIIAVVAAIVTAIGTIAMAVAVLVIL